MSDIDTISVHELDGFYGKKGVLVIDLRSPDEYRYSHFKGAVNIPYDELDERNLPRYKLLILYCDRGSASLMAARELAEKGYRVKSVVGGFMAYHGSNLYFPSMHSKIK